MCVDFYWGRRCFIASADCVEIAHCSCKVPNAFSLMLPYLFMVYGKLGTVEEQRDYLKPLVTEMQIKLNRECQLFNKNNRLFNIFYFNFNLFRRIEKFPTNFNKRMRRVALNSAKLLFYLP